MDRDLLQLMKPLPDWEGIIKATVLTISLLILTACGETKSVNTSDFTRGEAMEVESNNPNITPISGSQSNGSNTMTSNCETSTDCEEAEECDPEIFQCIPIPTNDERPENGDREPSESQDAGTHQDLNDGCSSTQDIQRFQGELVCKEGCDDTLNAATERCQQTPSRIADCLAEAAQVNQECQAGCPNLVRLISNCLSGCTASGNSSLCGVMCVKQSVSFSAACFACIENSINCSADRCQASCFINDSSVCEACIYSSCEQEFQDCAGIALP